MSLQERTVVVRNFDPDRVTKELLEELFVQTGPVRNIVFRSDHAFVEFEDVESVGYSKALLDGVMLHGKKLNVNAKIPNQANFKYCIMLRDCINYFRRH